MFMCFCQIMNVALIAVLQEVLGYCVSRWRLALVCVGVLCTGGLLLLLLYWLPEWGVKSTCTPCPLRDAKILLLRSTVWTDDDVYVISHTRMH